MMPMLHETETSIVLNGLITVKFVYTIVSRGRL